MILGPKTDNQVTDSQNVNQVGHNSGAIHIGLTFLEHEQSVRERLAELRADLERAHGAERAVLQSQIDATLKSLANLQADYDKTLADLADLKATLAKYDNQIDRTKHAAADAALDRGDRTLFRALLTELAVAARARTEDAAREEAELEFKLGQIAEAEIRWHDAARHYATAAKLNPALATLYKAREFAWRAGDYSAAFRQGEALLALAKNSGTPEERAMALNEHGLTLGAQGRYPEAEALCHQALEIGRATIGEGHPDYATRLNNLAGVVEAQGRYPEAEGLYRQALEIDRATIGEGHPDYAIRLNNVALVVEAQGRYAEAEGLYRQALEIGRATIGEGHPDYAIRLNNLACVVEAQGRYPEAEGLYRHALEIDRATIGEGHAVYANHLNNLAGVVGAQGRNPEAEGLCRQALEITRATIGEGHPVYANRLNNLAGVVRAQGRYAEAEGLFEQALSLCCKSLGESHPKTQLVAKNFLALLTTHLPNSPHLPKVQAVLAAAQPAPTPNP